MAGRVAGAMADVEGEVADGHRVAIDQPAIGLERLAGDAVFGAVLGQPVDPEQIVLVRALDRHAQLGGEDAGRSAMVDMAVGEQDLLERHAMLARPRPSACAGRRRDRRTRRASFAVHQIRLQFCCSGVTGMIAARRGGWCRSCAAGYGAAGSLSSAGGRSLSDAATASAGAGRGGHCRRRAWRDWRRTSRGGSARRRSRIGVDPFESGRRVRNAVIIAAEPDMVVAGDPRDMIDMVGDQPDIGGGAGIGCFPFLEAVGDRRRAGAVDLAEAGFLSARGARSSPILPAR